MKTILQTATLSMLFGWAASPAQAQLAYHMDDHGNLVYTNDDAPHAPKAAAGKLSAGSDQKGLKTEPKTELNAELHVFNPALAHPLGEDVLHQLVQETAHKHRVDPNLVSAVISTESNWNTSAISRKGALGLMQLIPETALHFGVQNPFDPTQNVEAGVTYLSALLERYNGDLPKALAAYNAGPRAVDRWGGVPDFRETREYVRKVTSSYFQPGSDHHSPLRAAARPIYRSTRDDGRVVFTNE